MDVDLRDLVHIYIVFVCFGLYEANDQSCSGSDPVDCYECVSHGVNKICSDPFNKSHSGLRTAKCNGTCVKWVKKPRNGMARYIRTCSSSLQMRISVALVCMNESPPEDGKLCFCHRDKCNAADTSIHRHRIGRTLTVLLALLVSTLSLHCDNHDLFTVLNDDDDDDNIVRDTAFSDHEKTVSTTSCSNTRLRLSDDKIHRIEYDTTQQRQKSILAHRQ